MIRINAIREHFTERILDYRIRGSREPKPLPKPVKGPGKLLEVGCGTGLTYFAEGLENHGIDITPNMIRLFKGRIPEAHAIMGDVMYLPFRKGTFKVLVSNALLHHLVGRRPRICKTNIEIAMSEMRRVIGSEGVVIVRELITKHFFFSLLMFYTTLLCAKLGLEINYLDIHAKVVTFFMDEKTFVKIALDVGFQVHKIQSEEWKIRRFGLGEIIEFLLSQKPQISRG